MDAFTVILLLMLTALSSGALTFLVLKSVETTRDFKRRREEATLLRSEARSLLRKEMEVLKDVYLEVFVEEVVAASKKKSESAGLVRGGEDQDLNIGRFSEIWR